MTRDQIAEALLGAVDWAAPGEGFLPCPGVAFHTGHNSRTDCRIVLSGAPTLSCFHSSCRDAVTEANRRLRSEIGKAERGNSSGAPPMPRPPSAEATERRARASLHREIVENSRAALPGILRELAWSPEEMLAASPHDLGAAGTDDDWLLYLLAVFQPADVVWIGDRRQSGPGFASQFKHRDDWLAGPKPAGPLVSPWTFRPGSVSRSKDCALVCRLFVVESDTLPKRDFCAVVRFLRQSWRLVTATDTGGKSIHAGFVPPEEASEDAVRAMLEGLSCDVAMCRPSQPTRLPGVWRPDGKEPARLATQALLYLDPTANRNQQTNPCTHDLPN